jgi:hypothetical protein
MSDVVVPVLGLGADRKDIRNRIDESGRQLGPEGFLGVVIETIDLGLEPRVQIPDLLAVTGREIDTSLFDFGHHAPTFRVHCLLRPRVTLRQHVLIVDPHRIAVGRAMR